MIQIYCFINVYHYIILYLLFYNDSNILHLCTFKTPIFIYRKNNKN